MKTCKDCKKSLPLSDFYMRSDNGRPRPRCKKCHNYWNYNKDMEASKMRKKKERANTYGITLCELDELLKIENCQICDKNIKDKQQIDHCHHTGRVRGVLCSNCNRGLGRFKDSKSNLTNAIKYLDHATNKRIYNWDTRRLGRALINWAVRIFLYYNGIE